MQCSEAFAGPCDQARQRRRVEQIAGDDRRGIRSCGFQFSRERPRGTERAVAVDHHMGAGAMQRAHDAGTDTPPGTGDQRRAPGQALTALDARCRLRPVKRACHERSL